MLLKDIVEGPGSSYPYAATVHGSTVYFLSYDGSTYQLWQSDGTADGTHSAATLPGTNAQVGCECNRHVASYSDGIYFPMTSDETGWEIAFVSAPLPSTNRDSTVWSSLSFTLALFAALTAAASMALGARSAQP